MLAWTKETKERTRKASAVSLLFALVVTLPSCATLHSIFGGTKEVEPSRPIDDPFNGYGAHGEEHPQNVIFRTRKGDRSVEIELPSADHQISDVVVPLTPAFKDQTPVQDLIETRTRGPSYSDREIASTF